MISASDPHDLHHGHLVRARYVLLLGVHDLHVHHRRSPRDQSRTWWTSLRHQLTVGVCVCVCVRDVICARIR